MFRFTHESREHQDRFKSQLRALRSLPFVMGGRAIVGSDTVTTPLERSRGFHVVKITSLVDCYRLHMLLTYNKLMFELLFRYLSVTTRLLLHYMPSRPIKNTAAQSERYISLGEKVGCMMFLGSLDMS
jgi:hypothetical protein